MPLTSAVELSEDCVVIDNGVSVVPKVRLLHVAPPSVEYWYEVIALPPVDAAVNSTDNVALPGTTRFTVGAAGTVHGMPSIVTEDAPLPSAFTWRTCNAYAVPLRRPVITIGELRLGARIQVAPPSVEYSLRITALPPLFPALNATDNLPSPGVIAVIAGALGALAGIAVWVADSLPGPELLTARMSTLYAVPFVSAVSPSLESLVMEIGLLVIDEPASRSRQVAPPSVDYS